MMRYPLTPCEPTQKGELTLPQIRKAPPEMAITIYCLWVLCLERIGYCYDQKELKSPKTFQWWYRSTLSPPENFDG